MSYLTLLALIICLIIVGYYVGNKRAKALKPATSSKLPENKLHSLPGFHGTYVALWCGIPSLLLLFIWLFLEPSILSILLEKELDTEALALSADKLELLKSSIRRAAENSNAQVADNLKGVVETYKNISSLSHTSGMILIISGAIIGLVVSQRKIAQRFVARHKVEYIFSIIMLLSSLVAVLTTFGVVISLIFETVRFFGMVSFTEFLFGLHWSPQIALREDQVASSGSFGAVPIFTGTLLITAIAMVIAVPIGLFSAIYMSEYATPRFRSWAKPLLEILAGIPTVVYGFFAALSVAPLLRGWGFEFGLEISSESAMAAGLVMGVMIIPFVSSLSDDVINAVPQTMRDGSYALGATKGETIKLVLLPAALPGIVSSVLLATSRAIGETMIVVMAAGLAANLTANPFQAVTTVTVQILTLLVGDQEFDSPKTLAAFALGFVLFIITLGLNILALIVVRKYREKYD
ncbi:MAG: phosphate ABC transporter permease subunit PstC [Rhizobiales bacterium]|nr:phosphate ABC transporter permease subunit PstC [Hyphomicrobiales bacterium]